MKTIEETWKRWASEGGLRRMNIFCSNASISVDFEYDWYFMLSLFKIKINSQSPKTYVSQILFSMFLR